MVFWKKKQPTRLTSDEFEKIVKDLITIRADIANANNVMALLQGNWRKLSAKVAVVAKEATKEQAESDIKGEVVAI